MTYEKSIIYYLVNLLVTMIYAVSMLVYLSRHDMRASSTRALQRLLVGIMSWAFYDVIMSIVGASGFIADETAFFLFRALSIMWLVFGGLACEQILSLIRPVTPGIRTLLFAPYITMYITHLLFPAYTSGRVYGIEGGWPTYPGPWQTVYNILWVLVIALLAVWLFVSVVREKDGKARKEKAILLGGIFASVIGLGGSRLLLQEMEPGFPALGNAAMSLFALASFIGIIRYGRVLSHKMLYQTTVNSIPNGLAHANGGRITWANETFSRMLDVPGKNPVGMNIDELLFPGVGTAGSCDSGNGAGGSLTHVRSRCFLVNTAHIDPKDPEQDILYVVIDVTDREKAAEDLKKSAEEKEILFRELQHRVKNNLSIIESFINLEMDRFTDDKVNLILSETKARVHTISAIYEQLHQTGSLVTIDAGRYLANITGALARAFTGIGEESRLRTKFDRIDLDVKIAVPLGIMVNELVTNCFKHAYPSGMKGVIRVTLRREGDAVTLCVADEGRGLPDGFDVVKMNSLGLKLVNLLARQICGVSEIDNDKGTVARVTFPA